MITRFKRTICTFLLLTIFLQTTGCGYFLHPERRGNTSTKKVDTKVAVLDAVGLIFFLVPGIIAFAVDYSSGTLYLPNGGHKKYGSVFDIEHSKAVKLGGLENSDIEKSIKVHTNLSVNLENSSLVRVS